jgi:hypothetical protein
VRAPLGNFMSRHRDLYRLTVDADAQEPSSSVPARSVAERSARHRRDPTSVEAHELVAV